MSTVTATLLPKYSDCKRAPLHHIGLRFTIGQSCVDGEGSKVYMHQGALVRSDDESVTDELGPSLGMVDGAAPNSNVEWISD